MNGSENGIYLIDYQFISDPLVLDGIGVYQIGKKFCDSDTVTPQHLHLNWFELTIAEAGKGKIGANGTVKPIESGDIFLSFPNEIHYIESDPNDKLTYSFFSFYFEDEKYRETFEKITVNYAADKFRVFRNSLLSSLVDFLISEISDTNTRKSRLATITAEQIVLLVARTVFNPDSIHNKRVGNDEQLTFLVMRYLLLNLFRLNRLSDAADHLGYNYSYLSRVFRKTAGQSITDYFLSLKMERAKILLYENGLSVTDIAEKLNYSSVYAFSKAFKLKFGISPSEYRDKNNAERAQKSVPRKKKP